jgi:hypothetical protein
MDKHTTKRIGDVIAALDGGSLPAEVRVDGVLSVAQMTPSAELPMRAFCPDGTEARCEIAFDSKGRQYCIWVC